MQRTEIVAVGQLGGEALAAGESILKRMHLGIASRPFGLLGPMAAPVRFVHDRVSHAAYDGVAVALRAASRGGASLVARAADPAAPALKSGVGGSMALGVLNGFYGDRVAERVGDLDLGMAIRRHGEEVELTPDAVAEAYPDATRRIVVFVHGLCGTDDGWWLLPLRGRRGRPSYGRRLQDELGFTPVYMRYNTGLRISQNGRGLAHLLDELVAAWPTGVDDVVLVGHSMGGLVARSACHYAQAGELAWTDHVRHVFCLGTPHLGADLEKGANVLGWALDRLPETRALAYFLNARSVGIKDLRFGSCVEDDWCDCEPDEFLRDRCKEVPFLAGANYYFVGATLSPAPVGRVIGDLLVRMPSASGRGNGKGRRIPFEVDNGHELSGLTHFDLLNHPAVYEQMRTWLTRPRGQALLGTTTGDRPMTEPEASSAST